MAGAHDYVCYTHTPDDEFTSRVMGYRNDDPKPFDGAYENWPADRVREAEEGRLSADQHVQRVNARVANAEAWLSEHPEFVRNNANIDLMNHELTRTFGEIEWTLAHYDHAYQSLRASNFLRLDARELKKQDQEAAKQRAAGEGARNVALSEDELYEMDMHELWLRADGVWGK